MASVDEDDWMQRTGESSWTRPEEDEPVGAGAPDSDDSAPADTTQFTPAERPRPKPSRASVCMFSGGSQGERRILREAPQGCPPGVIWPNHRGAKNCLLKRGEAAAADAPAMPSRASVCMFSGGPQGERRTTREASQGCPPGVIWPNYRGAQNSLLQRGEAAAADAPPGAEPPAKRQRGHQGEPHPEVDARLTRSNGLALLQAAFAAVQEASDCIFGQGRGPLAEDASEEAASSLAEPEQVLDPDAPVKERKATKKEGQKEKTEIAIRCMHSPQTAAAQDGGHRLRDQ